MPLAALAALAVLLAAGPSLARHSQLDGRVEVGNERQRPVSVVIDGAQVGRVGAEARRTLSSVPNGVRVLLRLRSLISAQ